MTDEYDALARKVDADARAKKPTDPNLPGQIRKLKPADSPLKGD
jgi:hypothetical protein